MSRPRALIFDMDGLLLDTEGLYKRSWRQAAKELGFDLHDALYLKLIGITVADAEDVLANEFGEEFAKETFHVRAAHLYEALQVSDGLELKPGVRELLVWAKENGVPCAVGTSTVQEEAKQRLVNHSLLEFFHTIIGGDMVAHGKPHPEIFVKAQTALGIEPEFCLVLEDAHSGLVAAQAGGMRSCLVPDLLPPSNESRELAEAIFQSLHEVREWLALDCPRSSSVQLQPN